MSRLFLWFLEKTARWLAPFCLRHRSSAGAAKEDSRPPRDIYPMW